MKPCFEKSEWFVQCVGIDISKDKFTACLCMADITHEQYSEVREFANTKTGFNQMIKWSRKEAIKDVPIRYLMEPTGVYYEPLAYHLHRHITKDVYVVLVTMARSFAKYKGIKTKTDEVDARVLASLGCTERGLSPWNAPAPVYLQLRQLTRHHTGLKKMHGILLNKQEAATHAEEMPDFILNQYTSLIESVEVQIREVEVAIKKLVDEDATLKENINRLMTVKGLGFMTIVIIIAETNGFEFVHSRKQLASYAGLDVVAKASGTQDPRHVISKHGNEHLRTALYFPAVAAIRSNEYIREPYERITTRNPKVKKIGIIAMMRKLLLLTYTLWKNGEVYTPEKYIKKEATIADRPHEIE